MWNCGPHQMNHKYNGLLSAGHGQREGPDGTCGQYPVPVNEKGRHGQKGGNIGFVDGIERGGGVTGLQNTQ